MLSLLYAISLSNALGLPVVDNVVESLPDGGSYDGIPCGEFDKNCASCTALAGCGYCAPDLYNTGRCMQGLKLLFFLLAFYTRGISSVPSEIILNNAGTVVGPVGNPRNCTTWHYGWCGGEGCGAYKTCESCIVDPFCGWCDNLHMCTDGNPAVPLDKNVYKYGDYHECDTTTYSYSMCTMSGMKGILEGSPEKMDVSPSPDIATNRLADLKEVMLSRIKSEKATKTFKDGLLRE